MTDYWIERSRLSSGYPVMVPVVDVVEIGNGGGSIAWVDDFGKLHVGPHSAGALPGPAAYGRGGVEATTTDANIALGRINKDYFFGGEIKADIDAVEAALGRIAEKLGVSAIEAARGIVRIANNNMINALKLVSINRGYDPRDFTLVAFGGGGAMHAAALGAELGVKKVVIPRAAPVFSAWGMMMSDLRRDYFITRLIETAGVESSAVAAALTGLIEEAAQRARDQFAAETIAAERVKLTPFVKCRYQNQEHSVEVALDYGPIDDEDRRRPHRPISRGLRAGIHLSARRAGRDCGLAPRRVGRGRQASPRAGAEDRRLARGRAEGPPAGRLCARGRA